MEERHRTWLQRTESLLRRQKDELRAAYVGIKQELGAEKADRLLGEVGAATVKAIRLAADPTFGNTTPPAATPADEDSFG